jgi:Ca-activated chloride channel family protein
MPIGIDSLTGQKVYQRIPVDIDEETLKKIADNTRGKYYRADNTERLQAIYNEIDSLEKTEKEIRKFQQHRELFPWFVAAGLVLLVMEWVLRNSVWRRLP